MAAAGVTAPQWKTTIIVSSSLQVVINPLDPGGTDPTAISQLQNHDVCRMLSLQEHRIRCSDSVESGSFIFPLSGTAFLLVDPQDLSEPLDDLGLIDRIKSFVQVHRNCFLFLHAPCNGEKELQTLTLIQQRFFGSNLKILPVRNNEEIVKGMLTIAKATSKPHVDIIRYRMALARAHIIETSPVWEMLRDIL